MQESPKKNPIVGAGLWFWIGLIGIAGILFLGLRSLTVYIGPEERGVVVSPYQSAGLRQDLLGAGLHILYPGERAYIYDIGRQAYILSKQDAVQAITLDEQVVSVEVTVNYAIDPDRIINLHITWQNRYEDGIVQPLSRGMTQEIFSHHTKNEIYFKRSQVEYALFEALKAEFDENYLILIHLTIDAIH